MEVRVLSYIRSLARRHRVLLLGGHAMIFHGLDRPTVDSFVWLDPSQHADEWCGHLDRLVGEFSHAYYWDLATRRRCDSSEMAEVVETYGVIRIGGLEEPLGVFRRPNNLEETQFDEVWSMAAALPGEDARVFSPIDLLLSKADTERQKDMLDVAFLEGKIRGDLAPTLRVCSAEEAGRLFARYADHETCRAALGNPHPEVRALAVATLHELAEGQNPFARESLAGLDRGGGGVGPPSR